MKRLQWAFLGILLGVTGLQAQQDPHYTQYMFNMNVINPAYAGSKENLSFSLLHRRQWIEIEDAPTTTTFAGHTPVGKNVGLGLSVLSDEIGPVREQNVFGDFSYTLNLGNNRKLALGLKAGAIFHRVGLRDEIFDNVIDPNDPAFQENSNNVFLNLGTGIFYYTDKYYFAFSVPNMLPARHLNVRDDGQSRWFGSETQHYFITGGYVFDINENLKLKPSTMIRSAFGAPVSVDANLNALFFERLEIGAMYRLEDSFGAMINFAINPNLRIGYAYDHIVSDLRVTTPSSHEIILLFDLNFPKKVSRSPRFF